MQVAVGQVNHGALQAFLPDRGVAAEDQSVKGLHWGGAMWTPLALQASDISGTRPTLGIPTLSFEAQGQTQTLPAPRAGQPRVPQMPWLE